jgi:hypothetical protein
VTKRKDEKLTLGEKMIGIQMVDGKKMITKGDSIAQIDLAAEMLREEIDSKDVSPAHRRALHDSLNEMILRAKERILDL